MKELFKAYEPKQYEGGIYQRWEDAGLFQPESAVDATGNYTNILPPPNANGELHLGHASGYTIMDIMGRYQRMQGKATLLLPGKDHAGIQTQVVYEKKLKAEKGRTRHDVGREKFYQDVYTFCIDRATYMRSQEKRVGLSADWSREKFTLEPDLLALVNETFVRMYNEVDDTGHRMIYRGERVIHWCHRCATALSDMEVVYEEQQTTLYTFRYWKDFPILISTVRPETKLGDTAVAVHPDDTRYKQFVGQVFTGEFLGVPLTIRIIADENIEQEFGTGALGVTPAHSGIDFAMAEKNNVPIISVIGQDGKILPGFGEWSGKSVADARRDIAVRITEEGLLENEETYTNNLSVCERCKTPIEPLISKQWFIDLDHKNFSLKKEARKAIENGDIIFYPERFKEVMLSWIDTVYDWCISRQIWWGPRIPVWYRGDEIYVGNELPSGDDWVQDPDTFDTWFSSGQWAYSTLMASSGQKDFQERYPSDTMIMGRDILPFWAFRMIFLSMYRTGKVPFRHLYFTGLVRDEHGQKMSKSKGNGIDVLEMIEKYGADATRLSLTLGATPGNDFNLWEAKIAGFRNFTNKLWNISRFILLTIESPERDCAPSAPQTLADEWIVARLSLVIDQVTKDIEAFRFSAAGELLRDFTWNELADWYLEIAKVEGDKSELLNYIFNTLLKLWHPYMPFVTEAIWQEVYGNNAMLMGEKWPLPRQSSAEEGVFADFSLLQSIITSIRTIRNEYKIEPKKEVAVTIYTEKHQQLLHKEALVIKRLARVSTLTMSESGTAPAGSVATVPADGVAVFVDLAGSSDSKKEKQRIEKELVSLQSYITGLEKKLKNTEFTKNAPQEIVAAEEKKMSDARAKYEQLHTQHTHLDSYL